MNANLVQTAADLTLSDEGIRILANPRVRHTLQSLREHQSPSLETLAELVAEVETTGQSVTDTDRERIRTDLANFILPKLDAVGYIEFDPENSAVTGTDIPQGAIVVSELAE